ncbi:HNH endonuclease [Citrobacter freundii]
MLTTPRELKASYDQAGYRILCLRDGEGNKTTHRVCRMVLLAFEGLPDKGMQACHGNNIKDDDRLENLRWGTASENTIDQVMHGVHRGLRSHGENHPMHKLSLGQVLVIKKMIYEGKSTLAIAKQFNVPRTTINSIKIGASWKCADAMLRAREAS